MEYRKLGNTGLDVSVIGLGMEHLQDPTTENLTPVVQRAIELGVNYIDIMLWRPEAQSVFGSALKGRRDSTVLAGHLSVGVTNGQYDRTRDVKQCDALFHDLLRRLQTDHVDVLFVSNVDAEDDYRQCVGPGGILELALRLKQQGKARFLALSGHSNAIALKAIDTGHIDVLMQPIHIGRAAETGMLDMLHQCASRGIGVVVMKTFAGGELLQREKPLDPIKCISYSLSSPGVVTIAMGVKTVRELEQDLRYLEASDEAKDFAPLLVDFQQSMKGTCIYCNHCLPCPSTIDIAAVNRLLVSARFGVSDRLKSAYDTLEFKASDCIECGECEARCPFGVEIIPNMRQAVEVFGA